MAVDTESRTKVTKNSTFSTVNSRPLFFHDDSHKTFVDPRSHPSAANSSRLQNQEISDSHRRIHREGEIKQGSATEEGLQHLEHPTQHNSRQQDEHETQRAHFHKNIPPSDDENALPQINGDGKPSESVENRVENNRPLEFLNSAKRKEWEASVSLEKVLQEPRWIAESRGTEPSNCTVVIVKEDVVTIVSSDDADGKKNTFEKAKYIASMEKIIVPSSASESLRDWMEAGQNQSQEKEIIEGKAEKKVDFCIPEDKPRSKQVSKVKKKKQGSPAVIVNRRHSRTPAVTNLMREIRKMSLASQDAREERKKAQKLAKEGAAPGAAAGGQAGSGPVASAKRAARRLTRRRKRREEEYTDKDRAAAVTLGSRDIKQSLKAKKKRERKLHISIDLLHSEEFLSSMFFCEAGYQMRVKQEIKSALTTLNKALDLQPAHKGALVARSQCHLKLGDAASALKDAQTSFKGNDTFIMGLYQYAEALYNLGQFEKALIAYHRGYRLRKQENFRIGIQKSQEAIRRAIGDTSTTRLEDLDEILPVIDELEANMGKSSFNRDDSRGGVTDPSELSSVNTTDPQDKSITSTITLPSQANTTGANTRETSPSAIFPSACQPPPPPPPATDTSSSASPRNPILPTSPLPLTGLSPDQLGQGLKDGISSGIASVRLKSSQTGRVKEKYVAREVLGQMYFDKDYLIKFLHRPDVQGSHGASEKLRVYATDALNYLETREGFWRQQNPMCARKTSTSAVSKSNSTVDLVPKVTKPKHPSGVIKSDRKPTGERRSIYCDEKKAPGATEAEP